MKPVNSETIKKTRECVRVNDSSLPKTIDLRTTLNSQTVRGTLRGTLMSVLQRYWWISPSIILNCHLAMQGAWPVAFYSVLISSVIFAAYMGVKIENSLSARRFGLLFIFTPLFLITVTFNFIMALGSVSISRDNFSGKRAVKIQSQEILRERNTELANEIGQLRKASGGKVFGVVQAELAKLQASNIYARTHGCAPTGVTLPESEIYCKRVAEVKSRLAAAKRYDVLMAEQKRIWADLTAVEDAPSAADPQASTLAILIGSVVDVDKSIEKFTSAGISGLFALIAEIMAAFGPMGSSFNFERTQKSWEEEQKKQPRGEKQSRKRYRRRKNLNEATVADIRKWSRERIEARTGHEVLASTLYDDFRTWCHTAHLAPFNITRFGKFLTNDLGLRKVRSGHIKYQDVSLKTSLRVVGA